MLAVSLALVASVGWGASDLLGAIATRSTKLPQVLAGSQVVGLLASAPLLLMHGSWPAVAPVLLGAAAGVVAVAELGLIYLALNRLSTVVMAPIAALGALLPVGVGIAGGDRVGLLLAIGVTCGLAGAGAASWSPTPNHSRGRQVAVSAAIAGGGALGAGTVLVLIDLGSKVSPWWTIASLRVAATVVSLTLLVVVSGWASHGARARSRARSQGRHRLRARWSALARAATITIVAVGLSDAVGDTAFAISSAGGLLTVTSVLASLYPVTTIALGVLALQERPNRVQLGGCALALTGVALLTAAMS